jgi:hypothetical protein
VRSVRVRTFEVRILEGKHSFYFSKMFSLSLTAYQFNFLFPIFRINSGISG